MHGISPALSGRVFWSTSERKTRTGDTRDLQGRSRTELEYVIFPLASVMQYPWTGTIY